MGWWLDSSARAVRGALFLLVLHCSFAFAGPASDTCPPQILSFQTLQEKFSQGTAGVDEVLRADKTQLVGSFAALTREQHAELHRAFPDAAAYFQHSLMQVLLAPEPEEGDAPRTKVEDTWSEWLAIESLQSPLQAEVREHLKLAAVDLSTRAPVLSADQLALRAKHWIDAKAPAMHWSPIFRTLEYLNGYGCSGTASIETWVTKKSCLGHIHNLYGALTEAWLLSPRHNVIPGSAIRVGSKHHADGWRISREGDQLILESLIEIKPSIVRFHARGMYQIHGFLERLLADGADIQVYGQKLALDKLRVRTKHGLLTLHQLRKQLGTKHFEKTGVEVPNGETPTVAYDGRWPRFVEAFNAMFEPDFFEAVMPKDEVGFVATHLAHLPNKTVGIQTGGLLTLAQNRDRFIQFVTAVYADPSAEPAISRAIFLKETSDYRDLITHTVIPGTTTGIAEPTEAALEVLDPRIKARDFGALLTEARHRDVCYSPLGYPAHAEKKEFLEKVLLPYTGWRALLAAPGVHRQISVEDNRLRIEAHGKMMALEIEWVPADTLASPEWEPVGQTYRKLRIPVGYRWPTGPSVDEFFTLGLVNHDLHWFTTTEWIERQRAALGEKRIILKKGQKYILDRYKLHLKEHPGERFEVYVQGPTAYGKTLIMYEGLKESIRSIGTDKPKRNIFFVVTGQKRLVKQISTELKRKRSNDLSDPVDFRHLSWEESASRRQVQSMEQLLAEAELESENGRAVVVTVNWSYLNERTKGATKKQIDSIRDRMAGFFIDEADQAGNEANLMSALQLTDDVPGMVLWGQEAVAVNRPVIQTLFHNNVWFVYHDALPSADPITASVHQMMLGVNSGEIGGIARHKLHPTDTESRILQHYTPAQVIAECGAHEGVEPRMIYKTIADDSLRDRIYGCLAQKLDGMLRRHRGIIRVEYQQQAKDLAEFLQAYCDRASAKDPHRKKLRIRPYYDGSDNHEAVYQGLAATEGEDMVDWVVAVKQFDGGLDIPHLSGAVLLTEKIDAEVALEFWGRFLRTYPGKPDAELFQVSERPALPEDMIEGLERKVIALESRGAKPTPVAPPVDVVVTPPTVTAIEDRPEPNAPDAPTEEASAQMDARHRIPFFDAGVLVPGSNRDDEKLLRALVRFLGGLDEKAVAHWEAQLASRSSLTPPMRNSFIAVSWTAHWTKAADELLAADPRLKEVAKGLGESSVEFMKWAQAPADAKALQPQQLLRYRDLLFAKYPALAEIRLKTTPLPAGAEYQFDFSADLLEGTMARLRRQLCQRKDPQTPWPLSEADAVARLPEIRTVWPKQWPALPEGDTLDTLANAFQTLATELYSAQAELARAQMRSQRAKPDATDVAENAARILDTRTRFLWIAAAYEAALPGDSGFLFSLRYFLENLEAPLDAQRLERYFAATYSLQHHLRLYGPALVPENQTTSDLTKLLAGDDHSLDTIFANLHTQIQGLEQHLAGTKGKKLTGSEIHRVAEAWLKVLQRPIPEKIPALQAKNLLVEVRALFKLYARGDKALDWSQHGTVEAITAAHLTGEIRMSLPAPTDEAPAPTPEVSATSTEPAPAPGDLTADERKMLVAAAAEFRELLEPPSVQSEAPAPMGPPVEMKVFKSGELPQQAGSPDYLVTLFAQIQRYADKHRMLEEWNKGGPKDDLYPVLTAWRMTETARLETLRKALEKEAPGSRVLKHVDDALHRMKGWKEELRTEQDYWAFHGQTLGIMHLLIRAQIPPFIEMKASAERVEVPVGWVDRVRELLLPYEKQKRSAWPITEALARERLPEVQIVFPELGEGAPLERFAEALTRTYRLLVEAEIESSRAMQRSLMAASVPEVGKHADLAVFTTRALRSLRVGIIALRSLFPEDGYFGELAQALSNEVEKPESQFYASEVLMYVSQSFREITNRTSAIYPGAFDAQRVGNRHYARFFLSINRDELAKLRGDLHKAVQSFEQAAKPGGSRTAKRAELKAELQKWTQRTGDPFDFEGDQFYAKGRDYLRKLQAGLLAYVRGDALLFDGAEIEVAPPSIEYDLLGKIDPDVLPDLPLGLSSEEIAALQGEARDRALQATIKYLMVGNHLSRMSALLAIAETFKTDTSKDNRLVDAYKTLHVYQLVEIDRALRAFLGEGNRISAVIKGHLASLTSIRQSGLLVMQIRALNLSLTATLPIHARRFEHRDHAGKMASEMFAASPRWRPSQDPQVLLNRLLGFEPLSSSVSPSNRDALLKAQSAVGSLGYPWDHHVEFEFEPGWEAALETISDVSRLKRRADWVSRFPTVQWQPVYGTMRELAMLRAEMLRLEKRLAALTAESQAETRKGVPALLLRVQKQTEEMVKALCLLFPDDVFFSALQESLRRWIITDSNDLGRAQQLESVVGACQDRLFEVYHLPVVAFTLPPGAAFPKDGKVSDAIAAAKAEDQPFLKRYFYGADLLTNEDQRKYSPASRRSAAQLRGQVQVAAAVRPAVLEDDKTKSFSMFLKAFYHRLTRVFEEAPSVSDAEMAEVFGSELEFFTEYLTPFFGTKHALLDLLLGIHREVGVPGKTRTDLRDAATGIQKTLSNMLPVGFDWSAPFTPKIEQLLRLVFMEDAKTELLATVPTDAEMAEILEHVATEKTNLAEKFKGKALADQWIELRLAVERLHISLSVDVTRSSFFEVQDTEMGPLKQKIETFARGHLALAGTMYPRDPLFQNLLEQVENAPDHRQWDSQISFWLVRDRLALYEPNSLLKVHPDYARIAQLPRNLRHKDLRAALTRTPDSTTVDIGGKKIDRAVIESFLDPRKAPVEMQATETGLVSLLVGLNELLSVPLSDANYLNELEAARVQLGRVAAAMKAENAEDVLDVGIQALQATLSAQGDPHDEGSRNHTWKTMKTGLLAVFPAGSGKLDPSEALAVAKAPDRAKWAAAFPIAPAEAWERLASPSARDDKKLRQAVEKIWKETMEIRLELSRKRLHVYRAKLDNAAMRAVIGPSLVRLISLVGVLKDFLPYDPYFRWMHPLLQDSLQTFDPSFVDVMATGVGHRLNVLHPTLWARTGSESIPMMVASLPVSKFDIFLKAVSGDIADLEAMQTKGVTNQTALEAMLSFKLLPWQLKTLRKDSVEDSLAMRRRMHRYLVAFATEDAELPKEEAVVFPPLDFETIVSDAAYPKQALSEAFSKILRQSLDAAMIPLTALSGEPHEAIAAIEKHKAELRQSRADLLPLIGEDSPMIEAIDLILNAQRTGDSEVVQYTRDLIYFLAKVEALLPVKDATFDRLAELGHQMVGKGRLTLASNEAPSTLEMQKRAAAVCLAFPDLEDCHTPANAEERYEAMLVHAWSRFMALGAETNRTNWLLELPDGGDRKARVSERALGELRKVLGLYARLMPEDPWFSLAEAKLSQNAHKRMNNSDRGSSTLAGYLFVMTRRFRQVYPSLQRPVHLNPLLEQALDKTKPEFSAWLKELRANAAAEKPPGKATEDLRFVERFYDGKELLGPDAVRADRVVEKVVPLQADDSEQAAAAKGPSTALFKLMLATKIDTDEWVKRASAPNANQDAIALFRETVSLLRPELVDALGESHYVVKTLDRFLADTRGTSNVNDFMDSNYRFIRTVFATVPVVDEAVSKGMSTEETDAWIEHYVGKNRGLSNRDFPLPQDTAAARATAICSKRPSLAACQGAVNGKTYLALMEEAMLRMASFGVEYERMAPFARKASAKPDWKLVELATALEEQLVDTIDILADLLAGDDYYPRLKQHLLLSKSKTGTLQGRLAGTIGAVLAMQAHGSATYPFLGGKYRSTVIMAGARTMVTNGTLAEAVEKAAAQLKQLKEWKNDERLRRMPNEKKLQKIREVKGFAKLASGHWEPNPDSSMEYFAQAHASFEKFVQLLKSVQTPHKLLPPQAVVEPEEALPVDQIVRFHEGKEVLGSDAVRAERAVEQAVPQQAETPSAAQEPSSLHSLMKLLRTSEVDPSKWAKDATGADQNKKSIAEYREKLLLLRPELVEALGESHYIVATVDNFADKLRGASEVSTFLQNNYRFIRTLLATVPILDSAVSKGMATQEMGAWIDRFVGKQRHLSARDYPLPREVAVTRATAVCLRLPTLPPCRGLTDAASYVALLDHALRLLASLSTETERAMRAFPASPSQKPDWKAVEFVTAMEDRSVEAVGLFELLLQGDAYFGRLKEHLLAARESDLGSRLAVILGTIGAVQSHLDQAYPFMESKYHTGYLLSIARQMQEYGTLDKAIETMDADLKQLAAWKRDPRMVRMPRDRKIQKLGELKYFSKVRSGDNWLPDESSSAEFFAQAHARMDAFIGLRNAMRIPYKLLKLEDSAEASQPLDPSKIVR